MQTYEVNKNGEVDNYKVEARSPKMAVQKQFEVKVYKFHEKSNFIIFDDKRVDVDQLYYVRK